MSELESNLESQLVFRGETNYLREYRFAAEFVGKGKGIRERLKNSGLKDWRFDFAWLNNMLAVEVEGGGWVNGRHNRGKGFDNDITKYHHATRLGWTVYRCSGKLIKNGEASALIVELVKLQRY